ncbi:DsbA family protein [Pectobacterium brasiliense]|uniref:DsbA family protein n=1 Tax=Pectobacterium brasiliense TaxID=180957 RepID=UPI0019692A0D|nr:DsbA family protein [Pectobacterium brasiliense]MBN3262940.1 DsbA family protein [Pectobacterium brasiliense]
MKHKVRIIALVTTCVFLNSPIHASAPPIEFTPAQQAEIGRIAAEYLVSHPEVIVQANQKLQQQQQELEQKVYALKVMEHQKALVSDMDSPTTGPDSGKVTVVQFFDYQCKYCSLLAPVMEEVMQESADVRFVFKDWPIFAGTWINSRNAAIRGLSVWKERGPRAYQIFHNSLFKTRHINGDLSIQDIDGAANAAGYVASSTNEYSDVLERNDQLAQSLGLTGTPGVIVMPTTNPIPSLITVFPGVPTKEKLLAAIQKAGR